MEAEKRGPTRAEGRVQRPARKPQDVPGPLFGLLTPVLVAALLFGEGLVGYGVLALAALTALLLYGNARTGTNLRSALSREDAQRTAALVVPAMFLTGIFGGPGMMLAVLVLAGVGLVLAATRGAALPTSPSARTVLNSEPEPTPAALPTNVPGEVIPPLDIRALCHDLPPALAGEVLATVEHLEKVTVSARQDGDPRRAFDADQGLHDYLPNTVNAWKAQPEAQRDPAELERALTQIRGIAGPDAAQGEAARQTWETQKRFLEARAGTGELLDD